MNLDHLFCLLCLGRLVLWLALFAVGSLLTWYVLCFVLAVVAHITGCEEREE